MPTLESEPAGSRPRKASRQRARTAWRWASSETPAVARVLVQHERLQLRQQLAVGVEHAVHLADIASPERRLEHGLVAVVAVVARGQAAVVGDVAGRLLEVGHEPCPARGSS